MQAPHVNFIQIPSEFLAKSGRIIEAAASIVNNATTPAPISHTTPSTTLQPQPLCTMAATVHNLDVLARMLANGLTADIQPAAAGIVWRAIAHIQMYCGHKHLSGASSYERPVRRVRERRFVPPYPTERSDALNCIRGLNSGAETKVGGASEPPPTEQKHEEQQRGSFGRGRRSRRNRKAQRCDDQRVVLNNSPL